jgi:isopropylmalate/isohomocitrate dehydrogenase-like protein
MYNITVISGDGIGPEVMDSTLEILDCLDVEFNYTEAYAGNACFKRIGTTIPEETIELARKADAILFGAVTTVPGQKSAIITLRKALDLYANIRPVKSYPGVKGLYPDLDLVIIRENTEGLYSGIEEETENGATALRVVTSQSTRRICKFAFEYVKKTERKKLTAVHKANVLKLTDGLFKEIFYETSEQYPQIIANDKYVDVMAMFLITKPQTFDCIVTTNLFGDILSDEGAGLVGGLGLAPSANIGKKNGLFEPVHGSGPDISGKGISNPSAMILSAVLMLKHLKEHEEAQKLEYALADVLKEGKKLTPDLDGRCKTHEMTQEIKQRLLNP